eukprot:4737850-Amphidinium_carterae.1
MIIVVSASEQELLLPETILEPCKMSISLMQSNSTTTRRRLCNCSSFPQGGEAHLKAHAQKNCIQVSLQAMTATLLHSRCAWKLYNHALVLLGNHTKRAANRLPRYGHDYMPSVRLGAILRKAITNNFPHNIKLEPNLSYCHISN